jgi:hypothetical protein
VPSARRGACGGAFGARELPGVRLCAVNFLRRELWAQAKTPAGGGAPVISERLKTPSSRRLLPLPTFVVDALAAHIERYGTGEDGVLFLRPRAARSGAAARSTTPSGSARSAARACRTSTACTRSGIPTHRSSRPVSTPRCPARPGHKSIVETMDTHGHLFPENLQETAAVLGNLYGGAVALRRTL